jgi:phage-related minor tail protein
MRKEKARLEQLEKEQVEKARQQNQAEVAEEANRKPKDRVTLNLNEWLNFALDEPIKANPAKG